MLRSLAQHRMRRNRIKFLVTRGRPLILLMIIDGMPSVMTLLYFDTILTVDVEFPLERPLIEMMAGCRPEARQRLVRR